MFTTIVLTTLVFLITTVTHKITYELGKTRGWLEGHKETRKVIFTAIENARKKLRSTQERSHEER